MPKSVSKPVSYPRCPAARASSSSRTREIASHCCRHRFRNASHHCCIGRYRNHSQVQLVSHETERGTVGTGLDIEPLQPKDATRALSMFRLQSDQILLEGEVASVSGPRLNTRLTLMSCSCQSCQKTDWSIGCHKQECVALQNFTRQARKQGRAQNSPDSLVRSMARAVWLRQTKQGDGIVGGRVKSKVLSPNFSLTISRSFSGGNFGR